MMLFPRTSQPSVADLAAITATEEHLSSMEAALMGMCWKVSSTEEHLRYDEQFPKGSCRQPFAEPDDGSDVAAPSGVVSNYRPRD